MSDLEDQLEDDVVEETASPGAEGEVEERPEPAKKRRKSAYIDDDAEEGSEDEARAGLAIAAPLAAPRPGVALRASGKAMRGRANPAPAVTRSALAEARQEGQAAQGQPLHRRHRGRGGR